MKIKNRNKIYFEESKINLSKINGKSEINIQFNRIAFIFFTFFIIYLIYTIHLIHLGSRSSKVNKTENNSLIIDNLYRADILDINGNYLAKTVRSIDIGIKTSDVIDKKKLLLSLKIIFPDKNFKEIEKKIISKK